MNVPSKGVSLTQAERDAALMEAAMRIQQMDVFNYQQDAERGRRERAERKAADDRRFIEGLIINTAVFGTMWAVYYFG